MIAFIDDYRQEFGVELGRSVSDGVCRVLTKAGAQIAPNTYYAAKKRTPSAMQP